jgi:hypothetical protein
MEMMNQYQKHFRIPDWLQEKYTSKEQTQAAWRQYLYFNHVQQVGTRALAVLGFLSFSFLPEANVFRQEHVLPLQAVSTLERYNHIQKKFLYSTKDREGQLCMVWLKIQHGIG